MIITFFKVFLFKRFALQQFEAGVGPGPGKFSVSGKIFSPKDRVPEFFSPRDSPQKLIPGFPRPANLSSGPSPRSRIF